MLDQWWSWLMPILPSMAVLIWALLGRKRPPRHVIRSVARGGDQIQPGTGHAPRPRPAPKHRRKEQ